MTNSAGWAPDGKNTAMIFGGISTLLRNVGSSPPPPRGGLLLAQGSHASSAVGEPQTDTKKVAEKILSRQPRSKSGIGRYFLLSTNLAVTL